jgi:hypothetical protein
MLIGSKVALISGPIIGVITADERAQARLSIPTLAFAKHISRYCVRNMIDGIPEPTLIRFVADK